MLSVLIIIKFNFNFSCLTIISAHRCSLSLHLALKCKRVPKLSPSKILNLKNKKTLFKETTIF